MQFGDVMCPTDNHQIGLFLHGLIYAIQPEVIVELGTWYGYTSIVMALAAKEISHRKGRNYTPHITTIDAYGEWVDRPRDKHHPKIDDVIQFLKRYNVREYVTPLKGVAAKAAMDWEGSNIDLLFFDADHSYCGLTEEYYSWSPHVKQHGIMLFHDYYRQAGVRRFIEEKLRNEHVELVVLDTADKLGLVIARKL